ncbi:MAG: large extracellular alpha-helical protein [Desulfamplus sp.]|nr:large extracellular alpha-helical protein [Desulfamplus sp.]
MKNSFFATVIAIFISILILSPLFLISCSKTVHAESASKEPLTITRVVPSGEDIDNQNQIVIQFDQKVVPIGKMERDASELPIKITPELKGQWRWLNSSDLSFNIDLSDRMKLATKYRVTVNPGIMTQDGVTLAKPFVHTFITRRPSISYYEFRTWRTPGTPVIALHFNQPVTKGSVSQKIIFSLENDSLYNNPVQVQSSKKGIENNNSIGEKNREIKVDTTWLIYPTNELPLDSKIRLIANYGILSALGSEQSIETKDIVEFSTFPEFKFAGIRCYTIKDNNPIIISPDQALSGDLQHIVDPRGYTELLFTAPVSFEEIKDNVIFLPDLAQGQKDYNPWANSYNNYGLNFPHTKGELYGVAFPQYLKAWQQYTIMEKISGFAKTQVSQKDDNIEKSQQAIEKKIGVRDMFGRTLVEPIDFTFYTDHRKAGYQILHETGVLEKDIDSEVPVAVTNIDEMTISYNVLTSPISSPPIPLPNGEEDNNYSLPLGRGGEGQTKAVQTAPDFQKTIVKSNLRVQDIAYFTPLSVREMLNNNSGAVYGKVVSTSPVVEKNERDTVFFTVVTPWQIHAKVGHFNTLVWITSLVTGEPVSGVTVTVHRDLVENLTLNSQPIAESITDENGVAMLPGMVVLDPTRETFNDSWEYGHQRLIVKAVKNNDDKAAKTIAGKSGQNSDLAIMPLTYSHDFSVSLWRVSDGNISSNTEPKYAHIHAWGTTPQGIYKAGDSIDYKIYVRDQNNNTFTPPPQSGYNLTITDPTGKNIFEQKDITLSEFSAFHGQYTVPKNGAIGWYRFSLSASFLDRSWEPLKVLVTDFTPSPFKVSTELNGDLFKPEDTLNIETSANLHSGGPYSDASARVTVRLKEILFEPDNPIANGFIFYKSAGGNESDFATHNEDNENRVKLANSNQELEKVADSAQELEKVSDSVQELEKVADSVQELEKVADSVQESEEEYNEGDEVEYPSDVPELLLEKTATLDDQGILKNSLPLSNILDSSTNISSNSAKLSSEANVSSELNRQQMQPISTISYGRIEVESAVKDDRGRSVSNLKTATYIGRDLFVGLKSLKWVYESGKPAMIQAIVVDGNGNPVEKKEFKVIIQHRVTKAARIKGAGNAYLTKYINEWVNTEEKTRISTLEPLEFNFNPSEPGDYRIVAKINQNSVASQNKNPSNTQIVSNEISTPHISSISTWVTGKGQVLWQSPDDYSLSIIPERKEYKAGETAKYLVKNPFPGAYALISLERYGVLRQWVQRLENSTQVLEVPLNSDDVPGFFLSVTIVSPRVWDNKGGSLKSPTEIPPPLDGVDLGKPTFRLGYVETKVKESEHDIKVTVKPEKLIYKPSDMVKVALHAENGLKDQDSRKIELAVAVLDESVFDLIASGRDHFDIFKGFHTLDGLDVENYSLLTNIIGRRKFEKKGASVGGDGGAGLKMRSNFKYVSYWNPSIITDENGNADIEFKAPDNLTGWKIFAIAVDKIDSMGLGDGSFKVNRPTEIRPVMPNQVTLGDSFEAGFNIMNRTDKPRTLQVSIKMENPDSKVHNVQSKENEENIITEQIELMPFKRKTVFLPVSKESIKSSGTITFTAKAQDELDGDAITHTLKVNKKSSPITVLNYGMIPSKKTQNIVEHLLYPENIDTDIGETRVTFYPTVIGNMEEAFRYMAKYPYGCWEQKISKAVMASHFMELKDYLKAGTFLWEEAPQLPDKTLQLASQFQAPNGGMAYFTPDDNYVCPYLSAYTALTFWWLKERGFKVPQDVEQKLWDYLATLLRKDVFPTFENGGNIGRRYSSGMASTVRAVALAAFANSGKINISDITRYEPHVKDMSLFGKAHFLMAAIKVKGVESIAKNIWDMILSSANYSSGKVVFSETLDTEFGTILESELRTQGAILSAIVQYGQINYEQINKTQKGNNANPQMTKKNKAAEAKKDNAEEAREVAFKLVRTITETRGRDESGENTQENIFCMNGLADYSAKYERFENNSGGKITASQNGENNGDDKITVAQNSKITIEQNGVGENSIQAKATLNHEVRGEEVMGIATFKSLKDAPVKLIKNITQSDLGKKADIVITRDISENSGVINKLEDTNNGGNASKNTNKAGTIYYSAGMSYSPKDDFTQPINAGMEIRREYSVEINGKWELLNSNDNNLNGDLTTSNNNDKATGSNSNSPVNINQGDLVRVDIFLSLPAARNFPVINDPVPGGLEPVNRDLATASVIDAEKAESLLPEGSWWFKLPNWYEFNESRWSFYHQEIGHDFVRYYADYLPAGNYHLSYITQAIAKGNFTAMPTHTEEMYNADIFGKGTAQKIVISESSKQ